MISRFAVRNFSVGSKKKVGFMGLGNMGLSMVRNWMQHGYEITAYDTNQEVLKIAEKEGCKIAPDIKAAATDQDICFTMLPNTDIVEDVRWGSNGIYEHAREGCLVIDSSTISPIASKKMAETGEKLGLIVADAPVSGGTVGAINGTLTFMVGSKKEHYEDIKEFLSSMGANIFHCGGPGTGQISKICNNLMLAIQMIAVSEGMALGEKLGMDPKVLSNIVSTSTGSCWSNNVYNPRPGVIEGVPSSNNYEGGFMVSLIKKDLSIVLDSASQVNLDLQFGTKAIEYYLELER
jgi:3-hydroxyisobutyrate dehydrogenase